MLLNFSELVKKFNIQATSVIQCGAHFGQEYSEYVNNGINKIVFIEPCEKAFMKLVELYGSNPKVQLINRACGDTEGNMTMFTGDNTVNHGMSNSLLKPAKHLIIHPEVAFDGEETVYVDLLDNFGLIGYDMLVMDVQGYEGYVLRGGMETLKSVNYVYSEINFDEVYENNTRAEELDSLLSDFERVETGTKVGGMWSDCLYIRKSILNAARN
jgi:FkbM family methyltransferase